MTETAVYLQPAFVLQQRNFRETSLIIEVLTRDFGRLSVLAKGVRKAKSKTAGLLQPFVPILISYVGKAELKTLTTVEMADSFAKLTGLALYCGFYVNELIGCFLHKHDPHPEVFVHYQSCLTRLAQEATLEPALRTFELDLLESIGYGLHAEINKSSISSTSYSFDNDRGLVADAKGLLSEQTVQAIQSRQFNDSQVLSEVKLLMRQVIDIHLQGRQLKSRAVINKLIKRSET
ncbi:MAG: DNA repair protein RecO [Methylobacter sp.]|nr:MAG: DNA repair protein RecO [Methylobacter sp.]